MFNWIRNMYKKQKESDKALSDCVKSEKELLKLQAISLARLYMNSMSKNKENLYKLIEEYNITDLDIFMDVKEELDQAVRDKYLYPRNLFKRPGPGE